MIAQSRKPVDLRLCGGRLFLLRLVCGEALLELRRPGLYLRHLGSLHALCLGLLDHREAVESADLSYRNGR